MSPPYTVRVVIPKTIEEIISAVKNSQWQAQPVGDTPAEQPVVLCPLNNYTVRTSPLFLLPQLIILITMLLMQSCRGCNELFDDDERMMESLEDDEVKDAQYGCHHLICSACVKKASEAYKEGNEEACYMCNRCEASVGREMMKPTVRGQTCCKKIPADPDLFNMVLKLLNVSVNFDLNARVDGINRTVPVHLHDTLEVIKLILADKLLPLQDMLNLLPQEATPPSTGSLVCIEPGRGWRVFVVGDLHSQYHVVLQFMYEAMQHKLGILICLGNYGNRGNTGCELLILLLTLKRQYPDRVILLRGLHETEYYATGCGLMDETVGKYGQHTFSSIIRHFWTLPLASVVKTPYGSWLLVHGCLSPLATTLAEIANIRGKEPNTEERSALIDILAGDLYSSSAECPDPNGEGASFSPNESRGFKTVNTHRADIVKFLADNSEIIGIVRANAKEPEGHAFLSGFTVDGIAGSHKSVPLAITVSSVPVFHDEVQYKVGCFVISCDELEDCEMVVIEGLVSLVPKPEADKETGFTADFLTVNIPSRFPDFPTDLVELDDLVTLKLHEHRAHVSQVRLITIYVSIC